MGHSRNGRADMKTFRAPNLESNLNLYRIGSISAVLGLAAVAILFTGLLITQTNLKNDIRILLSLLAASSVIGSVICAKLSLKFQNYVQIAKDIESQHLRIDDKGLTCFMAILFNNNNVKANSGRHFYALAWEDVETLKIARMGGNGVYQVFARFFFRGPGGHLDLPLNVFEDEKEVAQALSDLFPGQKEIDPEYTS